MNGLLLENDRAVRCAASCGFLCPGHAVRGDAAAAAHIHAQQLRHVTSEVQQPFIIHACSAAQRALMFSVVTSAIALSQVRLRVSSRILMSNFASITTSTAESSAWVVCGPVH